MFLFYGTKRTPLHCAAILISFYMHTNVYACVKTQLLHPWALLVAFTASAASFSRIKCLCLCSETTQPVCKKKKKVHHVAKKHIRSCCSTRSAANLKIMTSAHLGEDPEENPYIPLSPPSSLIVSRPRSAHAPDGPCTGKPNYEALETRPSIVLLL